MYPHNLFELIPPFPRSKRVFVAMSFDERFDERWKEVLVPAIEALSVDGQKLEPFRIDISRASDAILTEILTEIAESHCIVADISALEVLNDRPLRNANVMYEIGLAHAVRLPEEVILFRSDSLKLDFDIAGVRVHEYNPDTDPSGAITFVGEMVVDSLKALDARRRTSIRVLSERLTLPAVTILLEALDGREIRHPDATTFGNAIGAVQRSLAISLLLELGAMKARMLTVTLQMLDKDSADSNLPLLSCALTPIGRAMVAVLADNMGAFEPEIRKHIESAIANNGDGAA